MSKPGINKIKHKLRRVFGNKIRTYEDFFSCLFSKDSKALTPSHFKLEKLADPDIPVSLKDQYIFLKKYISQLNGKSVLLNTGPIIFLKR